MKHVNSISQNKNRADHVSKAKKIVKTWLAEGRRQVGVESAADVHDDDDDDVTESCDQADVTSAEDSKFDLDDVDSSVIEVIAKVRHHF